MRNPTLLIPFLVVVATVLAAAGPTTAKEKEKKKEIRWVAINYRLFDVDAEVGTLTNCAYKMCAEGKSVDLINEAKTKVTVAKKDSKLNVAMYVNKDILADVTRETIRGGLESAVQACFEILAQSGDEDDKGE
jgi:hypothetical protein